jgi:hypothetical protein
VNLKTTHLKRETGARLAYLMILAVVAGESSLSERQPDRCMWPTADETGASVPMVPGGIYPSPAPAEAGVDRPSLADTFACPRQTKKFRRFLPEPA